MRILKMKNMISVRSETKRVWVYTVHSIYLGMYNNCKSFPFNAMKATSTAKKSVRAKSALFGPNWKDTKIESQRLHSHIYNWYELCTTPLGSYLPRDNVVLSKYCCPATSTFNIRSFQIRFPIMLFCPISNTRVRGHHNFCPLSLVYEKSPIPNHHAQILKYWIMPIYERKSRFRTSRSSQYRELGQWIQELPLREKRNCCCSRIRTEKNRL